ncbi:MAG TPA: alpha/beta fold hydrolase [Methylomirabilota bacterium]|jgi:pimeloyl-ACP methyl ester carboxylesterase/TusA-related sulfurtransferase|nr:alpha/beta fold hydrolase [Methylomirabilota bacterium]
MPTARVNGVSLYYEEAGRGAPLLLIHAFPVGMRMWAPQVAFFARHFRVISYDCRGFGRSEAPTAPTAYSQTLSVADAHGLLTQLGAQPAAVCGLSMGGNIALNLALAHPESVRALIPCDTGAGSEDPDGFRARCAEYAEAARHGMEAFFQAALGWAVFAGFAERGAREAAQLREFILAQPPHGIGLTALHALATRPPIYALRERLAALRVPTLVVYGEHDEACVQTSGFMARTIPGARLWMVPGASHFVNLDAPEPFNETLLAFLREPGRYPIPLPGRERGEADAELDLRTEVCPYTFLKSKLALEPLAPGQLLRVVVGNETSAADVPRSLTGAGHVVLGVEQVGATLWAITVRKGT